MSKVDEIFRKLVRFKNGITANYMRDNGIFYERSYGVPIINIKRIATEYYPNHELAKALFLRKEREMKIAATFIDNPDEIICEQIDEWSKSFFNTEITEKVCCNLFYKTQFAAQKIEEWNVSDNKFLLQASWNLFSKISDMDFVKSFLSKTAKPNFEFSNVQFAAIQALISVSNNDEKVKKNVLTYANDLLKSTNSNTKFVGDEVLAFLDC
ncbi:MAG: DNA alkylation repair protein [Prevotellaceae bacterium]|jgi:3-methyladenine DNA glycosylase AlkD|nr:DNA alkylation repair protein [Prevotellaceae bacterium]